MALNFGLLGDAGAPAMGYLQGQQDVTRNQLAQQQIQTGQLNQQKAQMEMDAFKRRQAGLDQFMQKAKELGVNGDPEQLTQAYWEHATSTGDPQEIQAAMIAVQTARERKAYMASQPGAGGAVSAPVPAPNISSAALPAVGAPTQVNALGANAPRAAAPPQGNALGGNRLSQIENRLVELRQFPIAGKQERDDLIKERTELMTPHVVGDSLVTLGGGAAFTAPAKTKQTDLQINYQAAKDQGFVGSIFDYERKLKEAGRPPAAPRPEPAPRTQQVTLDDGSLGIVNMDTGAITRSTVGGVPVKGKLSAAAEKSKMQKTQLVKELDQAIVELTDVTKDGGLIDQSTGSGVGRLVDIGARSIGQAMPGDIAIGKLQPIADLSLKMIPRFEGPQSNADTTSYKQAAGQLADPTLPPEIRKAAGKTVLRLMKARKNQFTTSDMAPGTAPAATGVDASNPLLN